MSTLTTLLQFYGTTGWKHWGEIHGLFDDCKDDSDNDQPQFDTLGAAVSEYPEAALSVLASHLGLNFAKIKTSAAHWEHDPKFIKLEKRIEKRNAQSEVDKSKSKKPRLEDKRSVKSSLRASPIDHQ